MNNYSRSSHRLTIIRPLYALRKPLLAVVSTLLALIIAEIVVSRLQLAPRVHAIRVSDEHSAYQRSDNPVLRYGLKPNFSTQFAVGVASTNSHGLRDIEREFVKPPGSRRILILGDSVVEGINYVGDKETIPRQLEKQYGEGKNEVLNFGVSGYCTLAEVELLRIKGLAFEPDVVVLLFVDNDFQNYNPEHALEGNICERPHMVSLMFENSHVFRLGCVGLNLFSFRDEVDTARWNHDAIGENNVVVGLQLLKQLAMLHDFEPMVAIWPRFTDSAIRNVHFMESSDELVIEHLAHMNGIRTLRLSESFDSHLKSLDRNVSPRKLFTVRADTMHPSPLGCRIAARALHSAIESGTSAPLLPGGNDHEAGRVAASIGSGDVEPDWSDDEITEAVLRRQGRFAEVIDLLNKKVEQHPDDYELRSRLALLLTRLGRVNQAIPHWKQVARAKPDDYLTYVYLSVLSSSDEAGAYLEKANRLLPPEVTLQDAILYVQADMTGYWPLERPPTKEN